MNIYATNLGAPKYTNQLITNLKLIDDNTIIVGDFNTPFTAMDRSSKQKVNKETMTLNETLDQMDFIDIFRTFHPKATEDTFLNAHGTFSRADHILGPESTLNQYKKIEIIPFIFSDHKLGRLKSTTRKNLERPQIHGG